MKSEKASAEMQMWNNDNNKLTRTLFFMIIVIPTSRTLTGVGSTSFPGFFSAKEALVLAKKREAWEGFGHKDTTTVFVSVLSDCNSFDYSPN